MAGWPDAAADGHRHARRTGLARAEAAGGTVLTPARYADWAGFHGYFADPAGFRWEIATNPGWRVDADGRVTIAV
ncbi:MAG: hypothetical protein AUI14_12225 [Actinobacteria bacterium 13_2_20CM_2_71_6]|nr:MAG: hypothetical protein AUI14_12225 [Actinobacteria bacterium 13_2_20CM_2_71_6]